MRMAGWLGGWMSGRRKALDTARWQVVVRAAAGDGIVSRQEQLSSFLTI